MPAFNEAATIAGVLDDLAPRVDWLIVVDDGSADRTGEIVDAWAHGRDRVKVVHFPKNRGLSAALRAGWEEGRAMLQRGDARESDVIFSIDADGQHEPAALDGMIAHLEATGSACVIGYRDMGYHTPYKVAGNKVMTWIGRFSGGSHFEDIESGYRVFRLGPLLEAMEYYEGFKYSETVEVAVILARLGYRVDNTYRINIPVARTRTRIADAAIDAICMPLAWYRLACWKGLPRAQRVPMIAALALAVPVGWAFVLALMLSHPFYLGDDSAHSYAHVWYLARSLYTDHAWPWHVAQLENGQAVMFPYAIVPWLPSALLRPLLGDWVVTLSMVGGCLLLVRGLWHFRPEMRNPILFAIFLLNPLLWNGVTQFQLATIWAFAFFFFGAGELQRGRYRWAVVWLALAVAAHPVMGLAAVCTLLIYLALRERQIPIRGVVAVVAACVIAAPATVLFFSSPFVQQGDRFLLGISAVDNMRRLTIVVLPLLLVDVRSWIFAHQRAITGLGVAGTAAALLMLPPSGLWQQSHPQFAEYLAVNPPAQGEAYRVLTANNREDGMVEFLHAGATLANEFFSESVRRQDFGSVEAYTCFLATSQVRHVVFSTEYLERADHDEPSLLVAMTRQGIAALEYDGPDGLAYEVDPPASAGKESPRACGI